MMTLFRTVLTLAADCLDLSVEAMAAIGIVLRRRHPDRRPEPTPVEPRPSA